MEICDQRRTIISKQQLSRGSKRKKLVRLSKFAGLTLSKLLLITTLIGKSSSRALITLAEALWIADQSRPKP